MAKPATSPESSQELSAAALGLRSVQGVHEISGVGQPNELRDGRAWLEMPATEHPVEMAGQ